jgi:hypothetical protein
MSAEIRLLPMTYVVGTGAMSQLNFDLGPRAVGRERGRLVEIAELDRADLVVPSSPFCSNVLRKLHLKYDFSLFA